MKVFVTQLIQPIFKETFLKNNFLTGSLLVLLFSMSLKAETKYLFPSDIIEQADQAIYNTNRANRYLIQRHWVYPKDIRTDGWPVDKIPAYVPTYVTQNNSHHNPAGVHRYPVEKYTNHFDNRIYGL